MSVGYKGVGWSPQKRQYDRTLGAAVGVYLVLFVVTGALLFPAATAETLVLRALGTAAFLLLHLVLAIGPLCRLDRRWLPLLYNRRHLGVTLALLALGHGALAVFQFHALGTTDPLVSVLVHDGSLAVPERLPFQAFGLLALLILLVLAATSHDFWLVNLGAPVWKALHQLVYLAYALLVAHVALGAGQSPQGGWVLGALAVGASSLVVLHLRAAGREQPVDQPAPVDAGWIDVGPVETLPEKRARVVTAAGERVAVFRYDGRISAVSNVCQHQNGPLGEGRIIDGCITCPWHGYQYRPEDGSSPPPFTEKVCTFRVEVRSGRVWLDPRPLPPGTRVEPALLG